MDRSYVSDRFNENVTKGDGCWIWTGSTTDKGYAVLTLRGKNISAHRFSYEFHTGERIDDVEIDHRCRVRACVNPEHLRKSTRKRNQQNLTGARSDNRTGVRGVGWSSSNGRYRVRVTVAGKTIWGGYFDDLAEAEAAAIALRNEHMTDNETDRA